jgi:DNA repair protein RadA/Sms
METNALSAIREDFKTSRDKLNRAVELTSESDSESKSSKRLKTGISELDRVLGGGLVGDSLVLLGGDPGIGKSTLILQMILGVKTEQPDLKILYTSGEESIDQIRDRSKRLGLKSLNDVFLVSETQLENVLTLIKELRPKMLVMDSLQTFSTGFLESAPGSVSQVREVTARLMTLAKTAGISVWLIGHVTKEGNIAGPKVVEHMVDTVLYFESESNQSYRLLRTVKNRFGSTRELGVFEMVSTGLREVKNPSSLFLTERKEAVTGTAIACTLEGSRPILVELQALVSPSTLAVPRRTSVGIDSAKISLLAAIAEKHMKLNLASRDLFFNVAGGLKLTEPATDLAVVAAIWSSMQDQPVPNDWIFIGELGLTGEVRSVSQIDTRLEEAEKLGFRTAVVPKGVTDRSSSVKQLKLLPISRVQELPGVLTKKTLS